MNAPERIYLDGYVEVGDGVFPRCFENPKYASQPPIEYIRADLFNPLSDPRVKALVEAAREMFAAFYSNGDVTDRHLRACKSGVKLEAALRAIDGAGND